MICIIVLSNSSNPLGVINVSEYSFEMFIECLKKRDKSIVTHLDVW